MTDIIDRLNDPDTCMDAIDDAIAEIKLLRSELSDALLLQEEIVSMCQAAGMEPNTPAEAVHDALEELNDVRRGNAALVAEKDALIMAVNDLHRARWINPLSKQYKDLWDCIEPLTKTGSPAPDVTKSVTE